jgi:hypothetical protein
VRAGRLPIVGDGPGSWFSFLPTADAASAIAAAIRAEVSGPFNIVGATDQPARRRLGWTPRSRPGGRVSST